MSRSIIQLDGSKQRFKVGSAYFFGEGHDIDEVEFEENPKIYKNVLQFRKKDGSRCIFKWRKMSKEEFIAYTLNSKLPMEIGKFLVPEVAEFLGFTLEDLGKLRPVVERLDKKHQYERVIFESYIENGAFALTEVAFEGFVP